MRLEKGFSIRYFYFKEVKLPWIDGREYRYTASILKGIAQYYCQVYTGFAPAPPAPDRWINNEWSIAEYKADFDMALSTIGRSKWQGLEGYLLKDYQNFGRLQQLVIADILGVEDNTLEVMGFYDIPRLRGWAYSQMSKVLNGEQLPLDHARKYRWQQGEANLTPSLT